MRRRFWWIPILSFAFTACRPPCPPPTIVREYVAVPAPAPEIPPRPALPSDQLPDAPTLADLIKALLADRERLAAWALDLEMRLKGYIRPTNGTTEDKWTSGTN